MKPKRHACKTALAAVVITVLLGLGQKLAAQSANHGTASTIVGTWVVTVTMQNCQTHQNIGQPFPSLLTFNLGGTLAESTANPNFYPDLRLPGEGYWTAAGWGHYQASSTAFITLDGALAETQRIDQFIAVSGDNLASQATVHFYDPQGKLVRSGCAAAVATRYK